MTKGTSETALCHIACLLGVGKGGKKGRAHSLLANSIQKDADSRSEVKNRGRSYARQKTVEISPSNDSGLLNNVNWLMKIWILLRLSQKYWTVKGVSPTRVFYWENRERMIHRE